LDAAKREAEQEVEQITYQRKKRREAKPRSESFPAHFPRVEIKIEIPTDKQQLIDAGQLILKGYEARETLSYEPAKLFVKRYLEPVFAAPEAPQKEVARIEAPDALGDKNRYDASIAAAIVHGKFGLHLPYYRLQEMFAASGWTPSRSTLDNLPNFVDEAVEELPRLMARRLLDSQCVGMDDTGVTLIMPAQIPEVKGDCSRTKRLIEKMLEAKQKGEKSLSAKMWAYSGLEDAPYDVFDFRVSRHRDGPAEFLAGYQGHVMADCYSGNLSVVLGSGGSMIRMACWAHARRHVFEAREVDHSISALPLAWIGQLYDIERGASCEPHPLSSDIVELLLFGANSVGNKIVPFIVELRHSKVEHRLSAFSFPTHSRTTHPIADYVLARALDHAAANWIARRQVISVPHPLTVG
jgi:transposase